MMRRWVDPAHGRGPGGGGVRG